MGQYLDSLNRLKDAVLLEQRQIDMMNPSSGVTHQISFLLENRVDDADGNITSRTWTYTGSGGYKALHDAFIADYPDLDGSNGTDQENDLFNMSYWWKNTATDSEIATVVATHTTKRDALIVDRDHMQVIVDNGEDTTNLPGDND